MVFIDECKANIGDRLMENIISRLHCGHGANI